MASEVTERLSAQLNVPVHVGKVDIEWPNRVKFSDISLDDTDGNRLFEADHFSAGLRLLPLIQKRFVFTTIHLFGFSLNLKKAHPDAPLNLQFLIDAFSSGDSTQTANPFLHVHSLQIRHGTIRYDLCDSHSSSSGFDAKHLNITNLNSTMTLHIRKTDSLDINVKKLSFEERSGFRLNKLSMQLRGNPDSLNIHNLNIQLPETSLHIPEVSLQPDHSDDLLQRLSQTRIAVRIAPSDVCLRDLSPFIPVFRNFEERLALAANISGILDDLSLNNLSISKNGSISLTGEMNVKQIVKPAEIYLHGQIHTLHLTAGGLSAIARGFSTEMDSLPLPVTRLGNLDFNGEISGHIHQLVASGDLRSDIGSLAMNMQFGHEKTDSVPRFYLRGQVSSSELHVNELFEESNPYGIVRFDADLDALQPAGMNFLSGTLHANISQLDYNDYRYENMLLSGHFGRNEFDGTIDIHDPNGRLHAEGFFKGNGSNSAFDFSAQLSELHPDKLNITSKYNQPELSMNIEANFTGNRIDNFEGKIRVEDLSFKTEPDSFYLNSLEIQTSGSANERKLNITSDLGHAEIAGIYSFSTLLPSLLNTGSAYLPALSNVFPNRNRISENTFSLKATIENTEQLSRALKLPIANLQQAHISGYYDNSDNQIRLEALLPRFKAGSSVFENGFVSCNNQNDRIRLQLSATHLHKKGWRNFLTLRTDAVNDRMQTLFTWENDLPNVTNFELAASTVFIADNEDNGKKTLRTEITLNPTPLIIKDSVWQMDPASITIVDGHTTIDNFLISKGEQRLRIDGTASASKPKESIIIDLNDLELSYIFDIVNIPALQFGGRATGSIHLSDLYGSRVINTEDLTIQNFSFNDVVQGRLNLHSNWDNNEEGIHLIGSIYRSDSVWTDVNGYIFPVGKKEGLDIHFDANEIDAALLHPYLKAITKTVEGSGYGQLRLYGPFSKLAFDGQMLIRNGKIGVDILNTAYTFSDTIFLDESSIRGKNITVSDKFGNKGAITFEVKHKYLSDFSFQADIEAQNMLIYDMPAKINPTIYGTVFGSGNTHIQGNDQLVTIHANIRNNAKTNMGFNFMNGSFAEDYDFISFRSAETKTAGNIQDKTSIDQSQPGTEIRINCLVDVTPEASLELVMDPVSGDKIKGNGAGEIQIEYGSRTNLNMYGGFTIQNGNYNFSLQQIIRKDFQIREGSRIDFRGDPMEANLDLNALYFLTANIEDLDQALIMETVRSSIPINCILNLNGRLQNPTISFDMEFPNSTDELTRQVKSFIDTEDMMARQIIYLLVLNKFYTPDYSNNAYRSSEFSAVASSALSSQLSGILNSLTDKVQIGTNIRSRQDGVTDTEVEMLLSSQLLDNRLLFNGNFGYKNNFIQNNAFIGEFDLEYKLTRNGNIRLKAYNHANDLYRYNMKSLTRQGVGVMYRKDFSSLAEIFRRKKKIIEKKEETP
ncbi:MAG: translocation/assembly module TamB [Tannerella sp.]|jgi:hypothetical protein|nr:translocation/assembly module TamB [Tannerella sp.]